MIGSLLEPRYPTKDDTCAINHQKQKQQHYYDCQVKPLKPVEPGKAVRMRLPGESTWSSAVCNGLVGPWSYQVKAGGNVFARNRRQLITMDHQSLQEVPDIKETSMAYGIVWQYRSWGAAIDQRHLSQVGRWSQANSCNTTMSHVFAKTAKVWKKLQASRLDYYLCAILSWVRLIQKVSY